MAAAPPHALDHRASEAVALLDSEYVKPDVYEAMIECATSICHTAQDAVFELERRRGDLRAGGFTLAGAGLHPEALFADVLHVEHPRYACIHDAMRGLLERTPTSALHVHVGMPDAATAIAVYNRLRAHLPLLQALAAHSPYWHGRDAGFATARAQLFRGFPRAVIPRAFVDWDDYAAAVRTWTAAGDLPDYTYLWWDIRPHPRLGTIEVRAMDAQARLAAVAGLAALVRALASAAADGHGAIEPVEALTESSFRAGRDGLDATIWWRGGLRPVPEVAADVLGAGAALRPRERRRGRAARGPADPARRQRGRPHASSARGRRDAFRAGAADRRDGRAALRIHVHDVAHAHPCRRSTTRWGSARAGSRGSPRTSGPTT